LVPRLFDALLDGFDFGFAENRERQTSNAIVTERCQERFGAMSVAAGDDQGAMTELFGARANFAHSASAEKDASRSGEFKVHAS
jgi:hypothetical protein